MDVRDFVPPVRDRMAGRYFSQCPTCRSNRYGPDCAGSGPIPTRHRRKVEKAAFRRYLARTEDIWQWSAVVVLPFYPYEIQEDQEPCIGWCRPVCGDQYGNPQCYFTDREAWKEGAWNR